MPGMIAVLVLGAVIVCVAIVIAMLYNRLVLLRQRMLNAFAQIDVQLKRRHDLIPNLVESVKGYMAHERETLQRVIEARNQAVAAREHTDPRNASDVNALAGMENALVAALGQFMALKESYPDLKANQTTARLMEELTSAENRVAFARQNYNDCVMLYNTARLRVPTNAVAAVFKFDEAALFQIDNASERNVVEVKL